MSRGQRQHAATAAEEPGRDAFEIALARACKQHDVPLLGICRGMQLLNVAYGGTLHQHLPDVLGHDDHRVLPAGFARHDVRLEPDSLARAATGKASETVMSHHHQGPDRSATGCGDRQRGARRKPGGDRAPRSPVSPRRALAPRGGRALLRRRALVDAARERHRSKEA